MANTQKPLPSKATLTNKATGKTVTITRIPVTPLKKVPGSRMASAPNKNA